MSKSTFTAAVIGVGKAGQGTGEKGGGHQIGYQHARTLQAHPRVRLSAGADINAENLAAFCKQFGVEKGFSDYRTMLQELRPDIVTIGTYVGLHRAMIEAAARAGVQAILCEKPFLASPAEIQAVRKLADETGVKIVVAHIRRYNPAFERARELFLGGAVGQPVLCFAGLAGWDISEWGSHWLDMIRFFNGDNPLQWVLGQARVRGTRGYGHAMEEHAVAYFGFQNGCRGVVDGGAAIGEWGLNLVGTEGLIRVRDERKVTIAGLNGPLTEDFSQHPRMGQEWTETLADLVQWMDGGPEPRIALSSMLRTSELNLAAYLSALVGDRVDLPLTGELAEYAEWPVEALAKRQGISK